MKPTGFVNHALIPAYVASLAVILMLIAGSAVGLRNPSEIYPTVNLRRVSMPNDAVNLIIGLPTLLIPMWLARRSNPNAKGQLLGQLFWLGALFFVTYNAGAYTFNLPFNRGWLLALGQFGLSIYTVAYLATVIDPLAVQAHLGEAVPARLIGGVLAFLGAAFLLRAIGMIIPALTDPEVILPESELGTLVADMLLAPAWIIGGLLCWRREPLGAVVGLGLLYQATALFLGLIAFLLLQPVFTGGPLPLVDALVVAAMGMVVFVPFALLVRRTLRAPRFDA